MLIQSTQFRQPGLTLSLTLHALALAGIAMFVHPSVLPEIEQAIMVEIVTLPLAAVEVEPDPVLIAAPDATTPETPQEVPAVPELIRVTKMLSGAAMADPRNAAAREMLGQLVPTTLREQLCGIEAIEQIKVISPELLPEIVVANAFAGASVEDDVMTADGAAVKTGEVWRKLRFVCTLTPDLAEVTAFEFGLGDVIAEEERKRRNLVFNEHD